MVTEAEFRAIVLAEFPEAVFKTNKTYGAVHAFHPTDTVEGYRVGYAVWWDTGKAMDLSGRLLLG